MESKKKNLALTIIMCIAAVVMIFPFVWMCLSAFKTNADVYAYPPKWIPSTWNLDNFKAVFDMIPFWRYYANRRFFRWAFPSWPLMP